jgi:hypothetical protein
MIELIRPGDPGYAPEVAPFNLAVAHAPDAVVRVGSAQDIADALRVARDAGWPVSVQSTGHTEYAIASGLLISTRALDAISIDPAARTATIGAGARWGDVVAAAAAHGLMPVTGASPVVGVVGYLLGGGVGPFTRALGFSSDYLLDATVVGGAGEVQRASEDADLLWALRGGKYGLGVVSELTIRLVPAQTVYGGSVWFDAPDIEAALRGWIDWTADADAQACTSVALAGFPDLPAIPEPLRGRRLLSLRFAAVDPARGEALAAPLRELAPVYLDMLGPMPTTDTGLIHNDPADAAPTWITGGTLAGLDQCAADELLPRLGADGESPFIAVEFRQLGAAMAVDVPEGSAVGGRAGGFVYGAVCAVPELFAQAAPGAALDLHAALAPWAADESNINFLGAPIPGLRLAPPWIGDRAARLDRIRNRQDPDGVLAPWPAST